MQIQSQEYERRNLRDRRHDKPQQSLIHEYTPNPVSTRISSTEETDERQGQKDQIEGEAGDCVGQVFVRPENIALL